MQPSSRPIFQDSSVHVRREGTRKRRVCTVKRLDRRKTVKLLSTYPDSLAQGSLRPSQSEDQPATGSTATSHPTKLPTQAVGASGRPRPGLQAIFHRDGVPRRLCLLQSWSGALVVLISLSMCHPARKSAVAATCSWWNWHSMLLSLVSDQVLVLATGKFCNRDEQTCDPSSDGAERRQHVLPPSTDLPRVSKWAVNLATQWNTAWLTGSVSWSQHRFLAFLFSGRRSATSKTHTWFTVKLEDRPYHSPISPDSRLVTLKILRRWPCQCLK